VPDGGALVLVLTTSHSTTAPGSIPGSGARRTFRSSKRSGSDDAGDSAIVFSSRERTVPSLRMTRAFRTGFASLHGFQLAATDPIPSAPS
jgi:hypothetical protein